MAKVDVLLGLQWGDEGKGKIVDVLTGKYDIIARFQGGPNAGHTLEFDGSKHVLHTIPSGIFHQDSINIIGNGVIIDPSILRRELDLLKVKGVEPSKNLVISKKSHLILPTHRYLDAVYENAKGDKKIGSTLKGIGPTYTDKTARNGLRIGDTDSPNFIHKYNDLKALHAKIIESYDCDFGTFKIDGLSFDEYEQKWLESVEYIKEIPFIDSEQYINQALNAGKSILAEGAQGTLLDVDFGNYPYVTSSNTTTAAVCTGLGIAPNRIGKVYGVFKAYCTRVGSGPFPTELVNETGEMLRKSGHEFGSTTGRPRRCGWLDIIALKYSIMLNGVTDLIITKADVMDDFSAIDVCTSYRIDGQHVDVFPFDLSDVSIEPVLRRFEGWQSNLTHVKTIEGLPKEFKDYVDFIEETVATPITIISTGPDRTQTIIKQ